MDKDKRGGDRENGPNIHSTKAHTQLRGGLATRRLAVRRPHHGKPCPSSRHAPLPERVASPAANGLPNPECKGEGSQATPTSPP